MIRGFRTGDSGLQTAIERNFTAWHVSRPCGNRMSSMKIIPRAIATSWTIIPRPEFDFPYHYSGVRDSPPEDWINGLTKGLAPGWQTRGSRTRVSIIFERRMLTGLRRISIRLRDEPRRKNLANVSHVHFLWNAQRFAARNSLKSTSANFLRGGRSWVSREARISDSSSSGNSRIICWTGEMV